VVAVWAGLKDRGDLAVALGSEAYFYAILEAANRKNRLEAFRQSDPTGSSQRPGRSGALTGQTIDDREIEDARFDEPQVMQRTLPYIQADDGYKLYGKTIELDIVAYTKPTVAAHGSQLTPTASDINALVTWAIDNQIIWKNQANRLSKYLLAAYRASPTFKAQPDTAPVHIGYKPAHANDTHLRAIAHVINVTARETDYLVGCFADKALTDIIAAIG
jgi:hypothetical protein